MIDRRLGSLVLLHCLLAATATSCGGSTSRKAPTSGAEAAEAGASESHAGRGGASGAGASGAGTSGRAGATMSDGGSAAGSGESGSSGEGGTGNTHGEAGAGDTSGDAGAGDTGGAAGAGDTSGDAGAAGTSDQDPPFDLGADCLPPATSTKLSPAAAGLPANGLTLWLRGDRGVYATEQHRVCGWADQSGNKFLLTAGSGARPLWGSATLGAQPGIEFDASNSLLSTGGVLGIPGTSGRTFIAVVKSVDTSVRFAAIQQGQSGTPGTYLAIDANTFNTVGNVEGVYLCNNSYDSSTATSISARVHVFTINALVPGQPVLSNIDYRVNGATQTLTRNSGGLGNGNIEDFSGANFTLVGSGAHALMAEAIVYDRALTTAERGTVETALKARYGIQ